MKLETPDLRQADTNNGGVVARAIISVVKIAVLVVTLVTWTVVGFVFWIALLSRCIISFSVALIYDTITHRDVGSTSHAGRQLDMAVAFYPKGFNRVFAALYRDDSKAPAHGHNENVLRTTARFLFELIWALAFWYVTLYLSGYLHKDIAPDSVRRLLNTARTFSL
ncbi:MAG: hypothetical protein ACKV2Q_36015 [Planctomycetaceae bacterium]